MALINCPSCGRQMSAAAKNCPHCGHIPQPTQPTASGRKWLPIVLAILSVIIIGVVVVNNTHSGTRTYVEEHPISQRQTKGWDYIRRELNKSDGIKPKDLTLIDYQELTEEQMKNDDFFHGMLPGMSLGIYTIRIKTNASKSVLVFFKYGDPRFMCNADDNIPALGWKLNEVW